MTVNTETDIEHQLLRNVAQGYREKGFDVLLEPKASALPKFLKDFHPDLVAVGQEDNVVVEVKRTRKALQPDYLERLARAISVQAGWRLDIVVGDTYEALGIDRSKKMPSCKQIREKLTQAKSLVSERNNDLAIMLVSAAIEATIHAVARRFDLTSERFQVGLGLVSMGLANGIILQEEADTFERVIRARNKVAHGMFGERIDTRTLINAIRYCNSRLRELDKDKSARNSIG